MRTSSRHASNMVSRIFSVAPRQKSAPVVRQLTPDQWPELRQIRLTALVDSPDMFLSSYELEKGYTDAKWENEFKRGDWYAGYVEGKPICVMGVTKWPGMAAYECYVEYMWVSPNFRRSGVARSMLSAVLSNLRDAGYQTVFLWVLNGNDVAGHLMSEWALPGLVFASR